MNPEPNNNTASGSGNPKDESALKAPSKDPKKKDDKKDEDLSEEDLALKQQLELYVERAQDADLGLQKVALESMRVKEMYKNQLQELVQRSCFNLPSYTCIREGHDHAPRFRATVNSNGKTYESPNYCTTLRQAEHSAAEAVLEKQSYMLIGRHDVDKLMRRDPASAFLPTSLAHANGDNHIADAETDGVELEICGLLMKLRPIKQESLIRDNNKLILLASLSDSLEYIAESIERQVLI
ncbi:hypothetical protein SSX86_009944 [Deinandra increscens subsp. villosa]|uniref:DRBM domain-containing protein n=1 Tax=Deinandra increscens subsp. villosa TaxID=3103831 RepID=A0AAP0CAK0_9ASTR